MAKKEESTGRQRGHGGLFCSEGNAPLDKRVVCLRLPTEEMDEFMRAADEQKKARAELLREIIQEWLEDVGGGHDA